MAVESRTSHSGCSWSDGQGREGRYLLGFRYAPNPLKTFRAYSRRSRVDHILTCAPAKLDGTTKNVRKNGIEELASVLKSRRNRDTLADHDLHRVLEWIYQAVKTSRSAHVKATRSSKSTTATDKLEVCAAALRATVEAGHAVLSFKTATSVLDHIRESLPISDDELCEPLRTDYIKAFRVLVDYASFTECLKEKQWQGYLEFIVNLISVSTGDDILGSSFASSREASLSKSGTPLSVRISHSAASRGAQSKSHKTLDDLIAALRSLTAQANAPVLERAELILDTVIDCLFSTTRSQDVALETFNNVAQVLLGSDVRLLHRSILALVPIFRRIWTTKSSTTRDQLLGTLSFCQCFFVAKPTSPIALELDTKTQLLDVLQTEYQSRSIRDIFQIDDLSLLLRMNPTGQVCHALIAQPSLASPLSNWLMLLTIARLHYGIHTSTPQSEQDDISQNQPRKRRKVLTPFGELCQQATRSTGLAQVTSLQILAWSLSEPFGDQMFEDHQYVFEDLVALLANESSPATPWTLLVLTNLALLRQAADSRYGVLWKRVWDSTCRATATANLARPACLLIATVVQRRLLETYLTAPLLQSSLFSGGKNGPGILADTAFLMFINILQSDLLDRETAFEAFSMKVISWLSIYWSLPSTLDRIHNAQVAAYAQPELVCTLLAALKGASLAIKTVPRQQSVSSLALLEAWSRESQDLGFIMAGSPFAVELTSNQVINLTSVSLSGKIRLRLESAIVELLQVKLHDFQGSWGIFNSASRGSGVSNDILLIATSLCVVSYASSGRSTNDPTPPNTTQELPTQLWASIQDLLSKKNPESHSRLFLVASRVLRVQDGLYAEDYFHAKQLLPCTIVLRQLLKDAVQQSEDAEIDDDAEVFETVHSRTSQGSQLSSAVCQVDVVRREPLNAQVLADSLASCILDLTSEIEKGRSDGHLSAKASASFVDEVLLLEPEELLNARKSLYSFLAIHPSFERQDVARLIEALINACLHKSKFERSEAALCLCAKTLTYLAQYWTADGTDDLVSLTDDMYTHFIEDVMGKRRASSTVLYSIAEMLDAVASHAPNFGKGSYPSIRTSLLNVLRDASCLIKVRIAPILTRLFERFVLSEHGAIFGDIVDALPRNNDNIDGISARFHILADLGSKWHTILRQAIYSLFETAASVPSLAELGSSQVVSMCTKLHLGSPKELFSLFSSPILHTWLGLGKLNEVPFRTFGYHSLKEFCLENEDELVAQTALRSSGAHAKELAEILDKTWKAMLQQNFARAEAYCLASQISIPDKDQLAANSEAAIRKDLTTSTYALSIQAELPAIIAMLFKTLQDDRNIERAFEKAGLVKALAVFREMCHTSKSGAVSFSVQQPNFRSRFLIDEIQWLCSRTDHEFADIWSPAMLTFVQRSLLQSAHPALGPLHASTVLRKLRIVVALGAADSVRGYPLEMLLHNLRPYLTVFQCSEDAINIYQYLLKEGQRYLQSRLSFVAGLSISVFASLTAFVALSQDSTTQESHFLSTMSNAESFRNWLGTYLLGLEVQEGEKSKFETLCAIVGHAKSMNGSGSSSQSSHQGAVLLLLLEDQCSEKPLLQPTDYYLSISILCNDFVGATSPADDILASPADAARMIPTLEKTLRHATVNKQFQAWAAHTIGKGISLQGPFASVSLTREADPLIQAGHSLNESSSYGSIVIFWERLLWSQTGAAAASAEQCLQVIASGLESSHVAELLSSESSQRLLKELRFEKVICPAMRNQSGKARQGRALQHWHLTMARQNWAAELLVTLCTELEQDLILSTLECFASIEPESAALLLPYVVHIVLSAELDGSQKVRAKLSDIFTDLFANDNKLRQQDTRLALDTIIYLRRCSIPNENNISRRDGWLDVSYADAAKAAARCQMWHTALLLLESHQANIHLQSSRTSRRSTDSAERSLPDIVDAIFQNVDDLDFFYAGHEDVDVQSIVQRLEHEAAGEKMLSFQSAMFDARGRADGRSSAFADSTNATVRALSSANLKGLSQVVSGLSNGQLNAVAIMADDAAFGLLDWNVQPEETSTKHTGSALSHLRALSTASDKHAIMASLDDGLSSLGQHLTTFRLQHGEHEESLIGLALLSEAKDALSCSSKDDIESYFESLGSIDKWGSKEDFDVVSRFLNTREYVFGTISRSQHLRTAVGLTAPQALLLEARSVRQSLQLAQKHNSAQFSLSRATYFSDLSRTAEPLGVNIEVASHYDLARTLWAQEEASASVKILRGLSQSSDLDKQAIPVTLSEILADLGQKVTEARLEPPNEVIENYLVPAYKELGSDSASAKAGQIFHIFAAFCDGQLQDQESLDEFHRLTAIKETKEAEIDDLKKLLNNRETKNRDHIKNAYSKAVTWYKLDKEEWDRVRQNRESLVLRCIEHYLLSLKASDSFPNDTLRVLTIWLDEADEPKATEIVNTHLRNVPSWKFAGLVNQLISRLLDSEDGFQQCLMDIMFRICSDHPFHSLYQLFAACKSKSNKNDEVAVSRHAAANKLADAILKRSRSKEVWPTVHNINIAFVRIAQARLNDKDVKMNSKLPLSNLPAGADLIRDVKNGSRRIPPPTMKIAIRPDRKYSSVPVMVDFERDVTIAGGVSAPKVAAVIATDGSRHKMLLKGGNDDLRQDSIMEQVFEQVSNLLQDHRATRQRKLGIRTYKVVPLLANAGIIEFVQNTTPLHEYLLPAHHRYFPKDYTHNRCRKEISNASSKPLGQRIQAYRTVCQNFHPVMRFFFMEHFLDPDDWFYKRLNYSRSTAAISILGHVLGLGDRHGHNILLDTNTGEVVHIDLGVAFEAGRVLPIPEVVPFRLTRDLVDGMGISGVEGVFRRCCNFTLEALRREQESIMTILDVLRYDPLYSWSVSPLRVARMQENANRAGGAGQETNATSTTDGALPGGGGRRRDIDESAEASRALAVVAKKLGKGLSVEATVNELIRQASDERNLALLFCGWAAYV
ncbi:uncharacterized protein HMPREF1541_04219 [Cyphellophora europaea CBS 101466]|uniref:Serine/threonine-protein kinase Tel1 n=1 Tax=Cyphellophora europaea (strain CBS 101466) TaxID=1220924 RepID=W2S2J4_CYPE1|nr:uncharacterized protein HMPREF1541_04219 [Cyphellophora europaea CBS 101466]ETN42278.1 hypothetical protein HMPREF1541_04219 [Cyphellophora europaea CBS 101466]